MTHPHSVTTPFPYTTLFRSDNGDAARQIWLTEWGWTSDSVHPNYAWFAVSEQKKADNLVSAFQYARQNWSDWIDRKSHTSELQSHSDLVCRLLLEKKKKTKK